MKIINTDSAAERIAGFLTGVQRRFSIRMNKISSRYSANKIKILLIVYVLLLAGSCVGFIIHSLVSAKNTAFPVTHMRLPSLQIQIRPDSRQDSSLFNRIHSMRLWLDSVKQGKVKSPAGDSILFYRPGFYDSVILIEKIIQSSVKQ